MVSVSMSCLALNYDSHGACVAMLALSQPLLCSNNFKARKYMNKSHFTYSATKKIVSDDLGWM